MGNPDFLKALSEKNKIWDLKVGRWHLSKGNTSLRTTPHCTSLTLLHDTQDCSTSALSLSSATEPLKDIPH